MGYFLNGDSDWIRTNDLLLRRQLLYPAELPNHILRLRGAKVMKNLIISPINL